MRINFRRIAALVAGLWAGVILGIGLIAAPAGFASGTREIAGRMAGRMFLQEAYLSLALAVILLVLVRRQAQHEYQAGMGSVLNGNVLLVLGALFCTLFGYFALQPMMALAREGQGFLSFGALHGVSAGMFALKGLLVLVLAWRLSVS